MTTTSTSEHNDDFGSGTGTGTGAPSLTAGTMSSDGGAAGAGAGAGVEPVERLHRVADHKMVAGVAGGLADYFDVDPTIVRIGFVALSFLGGLAVPLYLAGWLLIPAEGAQHSVAEELLERERSR